MVIIFVVSVAGKRYIDEKDAITKKEVKEQMVIKFDKILEKLEELKNQKDTVFYKPKN